MYVITGATGNTGKPLAKHLLSEGKQVRVISRSAEKAQELVDLGAEHFQGDSTNPADLKKAFQGAEAVYFMIPPNHTAEDVTQYQKDTADAAAEALAENNVKYAITLSSVGAHIPEGTGVIKGLHYMENRLNQVEGLNVMHLRPGYFMENTLGMAPLAKFAGIMASPVKQDINIPMIATQDIAKFAANRLQNLDFQGQQVQYLLGSRDVPYSEVASVYGQAIGKPELRYVEMPPQEMKKSMMNEWGFSESMADNMLEFIGQMNEGDLLGDAQRDESSTTETTIEDFAHVFNQVYSQ